MITSEELAAARRAITEQGKGKRLLAVALLAITLTGCSATPAPAPAPAPKPKAVKVTPTNPPAGTPTEEGTRMGVSTARGLIERLGPPTIENMDVWAQSMDALCGASATAWGEHEHYTVMDVHDYKIACGMSAVDEATR